MTWDGSLPAYGEIIYDSRRISGKRDSATESFAFSVKLDPDDITASSNFDFMGMSDDVRALEIVYGFIPETRIIPDSSGSEIILVLDNIELEQIGLYEWDVKCKYSQNTNSGTGGSRGGAGGTDTLDYIKKTVNIGGGTKNVVKAESTVSQDLSTNSPLGAVPNVDNTIGGTDSGVEGTDVPDGSLRLQITAYYFPSIVTLAFTETIRDAITGTKNKGTYNNSTYLGYEAGEVSLLHVTGGGTVVDVIPLTFEFDIKRNVSNVADSPFPNLTMLGQDVVDYKWGEYEDANGEKTVKILDARYVFRVKEAHNYGALLIPGA